MCTSLWPWTEEKIFNCNVSKAKKKINLVGQLNLFSATDKFHHAIKSLKMNCFEHTEREGERVTNVGTTVGKMRIHFLDN